MDRAKGQENLRPEAVIFASSTKIMKAKSPTAQCGGERGAKQEEGVQKD